MLNENKRVVAFVTGYRAGVGPTAHPACESGFDAIPGHPPLSLRRATHSVPVPARSHVELLAAGALYYSLFPSGTDSNGLDT